MFTFYTALQLTTTAWQYCPTDNMARRLTQALAVLLAVCVAANAASTPSLGDLLRQSAGSGKVSIASVQEEYGYDQYGIETKELCLQETEMKSCGCKRAYVWQEQ